MVWEAQAISWLEWAWLLEKLSRELKEDDGGCALTGAGEDDIPAGTSPNAAISCGRSGRDFLRVFWRLFWNQICGEVSTVAIMMRVCRRCGDAWLSNLLELPSHQDRLD